MNRKIRLTTCLGLLITPLQFNGLVGAETIQNVPTENSTIPTMSSDSLIESHDDVPTTKVSSSDSSIEPEKKSSESELLKETEETQTSVENSNNNEVHMKESISKQTEDEYLVEGADIDEEFSEVLRNVANDAVKETVDGKVWTGYGKQKGNLTKTDMAAIKILNVSKLPFSNFEGIRNATNLEELKCTDLTTSLNREIVSLDLKENTKLKRLDINGSTISSGYFYIDYATNLEFLNVSNCGLSDLDLPRNTDNKLEELSCNSNAKLDTLSLRNSLNLKKLSCRNNSLSTLNISDLTNLTSVNCSGQGLTEGNSGDYNDLSMTKLIIRNNQKLEELDCSSNKLSELDVSDAPSLQILNCHQQGIVNSKGEKTLTKLNISNTPQLTYLNCNWNKLSELNCTSSPQLETLYCYKNELKHLRLGSNTSISQIYCYDNELIELDVSLLSNLKTLICFDNLITIIKLPTNGVLDNLDCSFNLLKNTLDASQQFKLVKLDCTGNELTKVELPQSNSLESLICMNNSISTVDLSNCTKLKSANFEQNKISDITSLTGLSALENFSFRDQSIDVPSPRVPESGEVKVNVLNTTAASGLTISNSNISGNPTFTVDGNTFGINGLTRNSLVGKRVNFNYSGGDLSEGAENGYKKFSGQINFYEVSDLISELKPEKKQANPDEEISWSWKITGFSKITAKSVRATLKLPDELMYVEDSLELDGVKTDKWPNDTEFFDKIEKDDIHEFTFKTKVEDKYADRVRGKWLDTLVKLDWEDEESDEQQSDSVSKSILITDDEQNYYTDNDQELALLSSPARFQFGIKRIKNEITSYPLDPNYYQTKTQVKEEGFYTRIRDSRAGKTGWKLTAQLSDFVDKRGIKMPNSNGIELDFEGLKLEAIQNPETGKESVNPTPSGKPSTFSSKQRVISGEEPTSFISAKAGEGEGTWQIRIPFEQTKLVIPANAGEMDTTYHAKLTWSLDDTP